MGISSGGGRRTSALVEPPIENMFGNAILQHFDRAASDHPAARPPHTTPQDFMRVRRSSCTAAMGV
jgi:hypothetical protein